MLYTGEFICMHTNEVHESQNENKVNYDIIQVWHQSNWLFDIFWRRIMHEVKTSYKHYANDIRFTYILFIKMKLRN